MKRACPYRSVGLAAALLVGGAYGIPTKASGETGSVSGETARLAMVTPADYRTGSTSTGAPHVVILKPGRAVPAVSSLALIQRAWRALEKDNFGEVQQIVDECVKRFGERAHKQQASLKGFAPPDKALSYSALNDVATGLFIKGKALQEIGRMEEAREIYKQIIREYRFAQCWDTKGWFWKVAEAAQDQMACIEYNLDFGDYTSATLTLKAWKAYLARQYEAVDQYTKRCIAIYGETAEGMQQSLRGFAPKGQESDYWALNDVATCLFIRAKALQRQGKGKEAALIYKKIATEFSYAQCWDPNGYYWKVAEEARHFN